MNFDNYKLTLNVKTCCMYEKLTGENFFKMSPKNTIKLLYCSLVANNKDLLMSYETFVEFMNDKKIVKWIGKQYKRFMEYNEQFKEVSDDEEDKSGSTITMTDIAGSLIMQHKIDPYYVMNDMELWEITPYFKVADRVNKAEQVERRFWSYLQVSPLIDSKKVKGPRDLILFDWEKDEVKKEQEQQLKNNEYAIKHTIGKTLDI